MQEEPDTESKMIVKESSQSSAELSWDSSSAQELISILQENKIRERELTEQIQDLSSKEKDLRKKIIQEIAKKQQTIQDLNVQIQSLQDRCYNLTQALCTDFSTSDSSSNSVALIIHEKRE
jgi:FixJ family two-component response regulator